MDRIKSALEPYLGVITTIERYAKGNINDTYKITTVEGVFSARLFKKLTVPEIRTNIALLNEMNNLPVPQLFSYNDEYIFDIDGKPAIVYHYIEGETLQEFNSEQLNAVGRFLAELHEKGIASEWNGHGEGFYFLPSEKISKIISKVTEVQLPHVEILLKLSVLLEEFQLSSTLPQGPIHVDVKPDNVLFHEGILSGVIDFDNAYRGPFILDLAKSMVWFGLEAEGTFSLEKASEILRGYVRGRRVTLAEYRELYTAIHYAFLSHIVMDYYMHALQKTDRKYFDYITGDFLRSYNAFASMDAGKSVSLFEEIFKGYQFLV